ncbi:hypothetical protein M0R72_16515 [Candidatus Pacearchaeota archaeon]|jgi:predicted transcriptional regulator|nr:hypothetical protein [Candidatus Pacearchaeota archaeon]
MSSKYDETLKAAKEMGIEIPTQTGPTLEDALLFIADRCDGASSTDGQGFNKLDTTFGKAMADKVRAGKRLSRQEYKDVYKMLKNYNNKQLIPSDMDIRLIPKDQPEMEIIPEEPEREQPSPETVAAAHEILEHKSPIDAHLDYVKGRIYGGEAPARVITMAGYSTYLPPDDRFHSDVVGSAQSGKSANTTTALETFPEENVIVTSEASPKSLYYLAQKTPERLKDAIVYIDDARNEHIPLLKTFRNEGNVTPRNLTVVDGEVMEMVVQHRPVVIASSVTPLRDMEQQATSRAFLASISDPTPEEEKKVRAAIRQHARAGAIMTHGTDEKLNILRTMVRILRDEGVREVLVPFDPHEPNGADRRGTGQFMRLIKISAFINQFQRPIMELSDGRKFVLAVYEDLATAAQVWFDFAEGQEFKISARAVDVLKAIPEAWPGKMAPTISKEMGKGQRTIERYLEDLYEAGIVSREKITAPGMPYGYWVEPEMRQKALSQITDTVDVALNSDRITTKNLCRKYMAEKTSYSLKDSIKEFFSNSDIDIKRMYKEIKNKGILAEGEGPEKIYLSLFFRKTCRDSVNVANDSDESRQSKMSLLSQIPADSDSENVANTPNSVAIPTIGPHSRKEDPGYQAFKANVQRWSRNTCRLCGAHFEDPLTIGYHGGGYICERCRRDGAPAEPPKADAQARLGEVA